MSDVARLFGLNVRHHRQTLGLTQAQLGHMVGVSLQTISTIEKGAFPSMDVAVKLARYFQVPLSLLVNDMPRQEDVDETSDASPQDAIQIQVLKLFRDLAVAPEESRKRVADWIRDLGDQLAPPGALAGPEAPDTLPARPAAGAGPRRLGEIPPASVADAARPC